jgi:uncharacterized protein
MFRQFVLKANSRCNLACDHCYVYESVDQGYLTQPVQMTDQVVDAVAARIREYARRHGWESTRIVLHGGEPLLSGPIRLRQLIHRLRAGLGEVRAELSLQTNGVLLTGRFARLLLDEGVGVGISLDGGRAANDRHRRFAHGGSSYDLVRAAVALLNRPEYRPVFSGLLCTVDVANDPRSVFRELADLEPPRIDFLLPHATWQHPPPGADPGGTRYGDWLVAAFDAYYADSGALRVRIFDEIMHTLLGGASLSEAVGLSAPASIIVETDGSIEQNDALKVTFPGAAATGFNVLEHSFEQVESYLGHGAGFGPQRLSSRCRACPIVHACGGGLPAHRYRADNGFDNPSVYCRDLERLILHIRERLAAELAASDLLVGAP